MSHPALGENKHGPLWLPAPMSGPCSATQLLRSRLQGEQLNPFKADGRLPQPPYHNKLELAQQLPGTWRSLAAVPPQAGPHRWLDSGYIGEAHCSPSPQDESKLLVLALMVFSVTSPPCFKNPLATLAPSGSLSCLGSLPSPERRLSPVGPNLHTIYGRNVFRGAGGTRHRVAPQSLPEEELSGHSLTFTPFLSPAED